MAKIQNQAVIQKLIDELELYPAKDTIPTELADKILPVFQVNTEEITLKTNTANVVKNATKDAGAGAEVVYTTPATGKFYLTGYLFHGTGGSSGARDDVTIVVDGTTIKIVNCYRSAGVMLDMDLTSPVLLDKATNITLNNNSNAYTGVTIFGYTED